MDSLMLNFDSKNRMEQVKMFAIKESVGIVLKALEFLKTIILNE